MDDDKAMLAIKETPPLNPQNIPTGMAGAQYLRNWVSQFKTEFTRKYGKYCKPYKFFDARWLWKGSIATLYDTKSIELKIIKNYQEFNNLAKNSPASLKIDDRF